jgi:acetolactate synthase-1/2/3 large subunit
LVFSIFILEVEMAKVRGSALVGKALKNERVKSIFTLSGELSEIYDTCIEEGIELVDMRHEQAVANAATGYAMATGEPGVCMVTAGPGAINLAAGMAAAWYACAPVVGICTSTPVCYAGMGAVQEFDSRDAYHPITKWRGYCNSTSRLPEYVATAFRYATTGRKGPVLLDIPYDMLLLEVDKKDAPIVPLQKYRTDARPYGDPQLVKKAAKWLLEAERPGILIGSGILWSNASKELLKFAEMLKVPVCYAIGGKGGIPDDHPLCGGPVGLDFGSIAGADVLLAIGVRFEEILNFGTGNFYAPDAKVISVDIEPLEIGRNRPVDLGIWGDARAVLTQLIEEAKEALRASGKRRGETKWVKTVKSIAKSIQDTLTEGASSPSKPIDPRRLGKEVCEFLGDDSVIVMDGGDIHAHVTPLFHANQPRSYINALGGSLGHLGGGIPFGIGIKTAKPDKKVVVITGDGSFLLNASEIDTAVRHKKQIVVVVSNDCQWGMVRHDQQLNQCREACSILSEEVRYDKYAESLGAYGELVTEPRQVKPALKRAFDSGLPAVLDVRTDPTVLSFADYRGAEARNTLIEMHKK